MFNRTSVLAAALFGFGAAILPATQPARDDVMLELVLTPQGGTEPEDVAIARAQQEAARPGAGAADLERLAWAYVAKGRRSLDSGCYTLAASTAGVMEGRFGVTPESRLILGHVQHSMHRFAEAETTARELVASRGAAADYALLSDALMEEGRVDEAVTAVQCMMQLRPGTEAYVRAAYLRWLKGDLTGAIAAMETAGRSTSASEPETAAWVLTRLSGYELQAHELPEAEALARRALVAAPEYPPALLALGRASWALGRPAEALAAVRRAAALNPLPEYQWWLADLLRETGRVAEAVRVETDLAVRGPVTDPRTVALFLATRGSEVEHARRLAEAELTSRRDVFTHDAVAWTALAGGDLRTAEDAMRLALAQRTGDARLLLHAGELFARLHQPVDSVRCLARASGAAATLTPGEQRRLTTDLQRFAPAAMAVAGFSGSKIPTCNP